MATVRRERHAECLSVGWKLVKDWIIHVRIDPARAVGVAACAVPCTEGDDVADRPSKSSCRHEIQPGRTVGVEQRGERVVHLGDLLPNNPGVGGVPEPAAEAEIHPGDRNARWVAIVVEVVAHARRAADQR